MRLIGLLVVVAACGGGHREYHDDGGSEVVFAITRDGAPVAVDLDQIKRAVAGTGARDVEVARIPQGVDVRSHTLLDPPQATKDQVIAALARLPKVTWGGTHLYVRSESPIPDDEVRAALAAAGLEVDPSNSFARQDPDLAEYDNVYAVYGLDRAWRAAIEARLPGTTVVVVSAEEVGPQHRAGGPLTR